MDDVTRGQAHLHSFGTFTSNHLAGNLRGHFMQLDVHPVDLFNPINDCSWDAFSSFPGELCDSSIQPPQLAHRARALFSRTRLCVGLAASKLLSDCPICTVDKDVQ